MTDDTQEVEIIIEPNSQPQALLDRVREALAFHGPQLYLKSRKQVKMVFIKQLIPSEDPTVDTKPEDQPQVKALPPKEAVPSEPPKAQPASQPLES